MSSFLAEARIVVRPDTTAFRAELEAQLRAVTSTPIRIPVVAAVAPANVAAATVAAQAAATGQRTVAAAAQEAGAASQAAAASTVRLSTAQNAAAVAAQKLALAESAVVGASSAVSAAQVTLTRSTAAVAAAQAAVGVAFRANDAAMISSTKNTLALAAAQELEAKSALSAARAEAARAGSLGQLTRGAGASGLSLFGLRGATLAASGAFLAGTAAVVGFAKAVQSAANLETELNVFRVTAGATADEMDRVSASAKQLGRDITLPGVTAGDAATAMTELAKAGLSVQDSLAGARGALQLATAAQIDNVTATNLIAGALNSFELAGTDAVKVADLLTGAAKESQGEISDMGTALAQAASVSHQFGVSIEDTITLLTQLAKAGISGGRAGTSLRVAFLRLVNPTKNAAKILKELNVQVEDATTGDLNVHIFTDIQKALEGYTNAQQRAKAATLFGTDAIRTFGIIGSQGALRFEQLGAAVSEFGLAQEAAAARTSGLQGSFENLSNQVSGLGLTFGNVVKGPLKLFVDTVANQISVANLAADALVSLAITVGDLGKSFGDSIPFMDTFRDHLGGIAKLAALGNPLTALPVASSELVNKFGKDSQDSFLKGADAAAVLGQRIEAIVATGRKTGGDLGLNEALVNLDLLVEQLRNGSPEAQKFAGAVEQVRKRLAATAGLKIFPDNVRDLFPKDLLAGTESAFGEAGKKGGEAFKSELQKALSGNQIFTSTLDFLDQIVVGAKEASAQVKNAAASGLNVKQIQNVIVGFDAKEVRAKIAGDNAELLDVLNTGQEFLERQLQRDFVKRRPALQRTIEQALLGTVNDIEAIQSQAKSKTESVRRDAEKAANEAAQAVKDREQALLAQFGVARDQQANKIAAAAQTQGLKDDITRQKQLKSLVLQQIASVRERITIEGGRKAAVVALQSVLQTVNASLAGLAQQQQQAAEEQRQALLQGIGLDIDLAQITGNQSAEVKARNRKISELNKDLAAEAKAHGKTTVAYKTIRNEIAQQQKNQQEQRQALLQGIGLDIDLAQTTENQAAEVKARNRLIAQLNKDLAAEAKAHGKTTVAYKTIRNEIAAQNAALKEIAKEKQKGQSFAQASFEFLQTQQGFASNLLGNLIPSGATSGLVGGSSVQGALTPVASAADGRSQSGPTAGQAQSTNATLLRILDQLKILNGGNAAPEAQRQHRFQGALMDGVGGG